MKQQVLDAVDAQPRQTLAHPRADPVQSLDRHGTPADVRIGLGETGLVGRVGAGSSLADCGARWFGGAGALAFPRPQTGQSDRRFRWSRPPNPDPDPHDPPAHPVQSRTRGRGTYDITAEIARQVRDCGVRTGLCHCFVRHTSASLILCENADPTVRRDLESFLARLVPDGDPLFDHHDEGPDDMPAHVRTILTKTDLTLPVRDGLWPSGPGRGSISTSTAPGAPAAGPADRHGRMRDRRTQRPLVQDRRLRASHPLTRTAACETRVPPSPPIRARTALPS